MKVEGSRCEHSTEICPPPKKIIVHLNSATVILLIRVSRY